MVKQDTEVRRDPNSSSEVLGRYRAGTQIKIQTPDQNGWYSIPFSKVYKGANQGWVRKDAIELQPGGSRVSTQARTKRGGGETGKAKKYAVGLIVDDFMLNPSAYMTGVGMTPKSFSSIGFGANFELMLSESLYGFIGAGYFSTSQPTNAGTTDGLFAKGFSAQLGLELVLLRLSRAQIRLGAGFGAAMMTAGNTNDTFSPAQQISTTGILSPYFFGQLAGEIPFSSGNGVGLGLRLEAGYRALTLKGVPSLLTTAPNTQGPIDMGLSGLYLGGGLLVYF